MRRLHLAPVAATLILGACGVPTQRALPWNRADQLPRPVCSHEQVVELTSRLGRRWPGGGDFDLRCVGGRFPELGFFVEARWSDVRRVGIVGIGKDRELIPFIEVADRSVPIIRELFVADLDGNGIDEIGDAWRGESQGTSGDQLMLWTTNGAKLERIEGPHLSAYRPGLGSCLARVDVRRRAISITVETSHGLSPTECLPNGRHRFVMRDGRLVPTSARRRPGAHASARPGVIGSS
jgi:hypothetical protein